MPFLAGTNPRSASSAVGKGPTTDPHVLSKRGLRVSDTRSEHEPNLARNAPAGYQPVNERGDGHRVPGAKCGGAHHRLGTERPTGRSAVSPPPGLPPIRTLDDIQGRARSLLGQEHNPERAVTRIDEPNPAHDHCGELRRPNTTLGRQAEVIRNASNRHSVRSPALGM